jgi:hypothetical protein
VLTHPDRHDPCRDDHQGSTHRPPRPRSSPARTAITAVTAPLGGDDRRDDSDLADPQSRVHQQQPRAIADSGDDQPNGSRLRRRRAGPETAAQGSVTTRLVSITQASTEGTPISRVARAAQMTVVAQANAAPSPPKTAIMVLSLIAVFAATRLAASPQCEPKQRSFDQQPIASTDRCEPRARAKRSEGRAWAVQGSNLRPWD